jgi:hypothetical protein
VAPKVIKVIMVVLVNSFMAGVITLAPHGPANDPGEREGLGSTSRPTAETRWLIAS